MLMRYVEVMTSGKTTSSEKIGSFVCACVVLCNVFLVTLVSELTYLRPQHTQLSLVEKH